MFQVLFDKFQSTFKKLSGRGRLSENNIKEAVREIRLALLAADVNVQVVREFVEKISEKACGADLLNSLTPHQQFIKIVYDELVHLMGETPRGLDLGFKPPVVIMCVGLQGTGKTTTVAKLALELKKRRSRRPYLIPADTKRPAAIKQLQVLAGEIDVEVYKTSPGDSALKVALEGVKDAAMRGYDLVLIDTAGRLHVDDELMEELKELKQRLCPQHVILIVDSMTGQDAVKSTRAFHDALRLSGAILTKLDGDARGGAALSMRFLTGCPILYTGTGEKVTDIEQFYPERMASRILGMGDVVSLVEKVQESVETDKAEELAKKFAKNQFTLEDFLEQLKLVKKVGSFDKIIGMIPGVGNMVKEVNEAEVEKGFKNKVAILNSMTMEERLNHRILNGSRRRRIATGSGTEVSDVNRLIKEYEAISKLMGRVKSGGIKNLGNLFNKFM